MAHAASSNASNVVNRSESNENIFVSTTNPSSFFCFCIFLVILF